jgi:hypothetical protein
VNYVGSGEWVKLKKVRPLSISFLVPLYTCLYFTHLLPNNSYWQTTRKRRKRTKTKTTKTCLLALYLHQQLPLGLVQPPQQLVILLLRELFLPLLLPVDLRNKSPMTLLG